MKKIVLSLIIILSIIFGLVLLSVVWVCYLNKYINCMPTVVMPGETESTFCDEFKCYWAEIFCPDKIAW